MIPRKLPEMLRGRLRPPDDCPQPSEGERAAAVLLALYQEEDAWHLLLTRRTETVIEDKGQVALPGGAVNLNHLTRAETILR